MSGTAVAVDGGETCQSLSWDADVPFGCLVRHEHTICPSDLDPRQVIVQCHHSFLIRPLGLSRRLDDPRSGVSYSISYAGCRPLCSYACTNSPRFASVVQVLAIELLDKIYLLRNFRFDSVIPVLPSLLTLCLEIFE